MLLLFNDKQKQHLNLLKDVDDKVVCDFCRIAVENLIDGTNHKVYQVAAQKLNLEPELVQFAIIGIMNLLTEASKLMIPEIEFRDSLMVLGFQDHVLEELVKVYLENHEKVRSLLTSMHLEIPHYQKLEWRLEVQIASRSLYRPMEPKFLLKLQLKKGKNIEDIILEADPADIIHITENLEKALKEARSHHCRRIMKSIK